MQTRVNPDPESESELRNVGSLTNAKPATVILQALLAGSPLLASQFQPPRSEGYFIDDYGLDEERVALESAMGKTEQKPER